MIKFNNWLKATGMLLSIGYGSLPAMAQTTGVTSGYETEVHKNALSDTLSISFGGQGKVLLIGANFNDYKAYAAQAEQTKTYFINDLEKAYNQKQISAQTQEVHYFLYNTQKRRIKAEAPEYSENKVDVNYEIKRMELDLPKYRYVVHDLAAGMEWEIYVSNPDSIIPQLGELGLQHAIETALANKKQYRKFVRIDLDNNFGINNTPVKRLDMLQISPIISVMFLGNTISPALGGNFELGFSNKYGIMQYRASLLLYGLSLLQTTNNEITGIDFVNAYEGRFLINMHGNAQVEPFWVGIQAGLLKSKDLNTYNNAFKFGFTYERRNIGWSFDLIKPEDSWKSQKAVYAVTIRLPF